MKKSKESSTKKVEKIYLTKEIKKVQARKILKVYDDPKLIVGLFRKKKLIGVSIAYDLTKKELKNHFKGLGCKIENVKKWQSKILNKYKNFDTKLLLLRGGYKISRKKFPRVCYSITLKLAKK